MIDIKVKISTREVEQMLGDLAHKMPSAYARGLTETAKDAKSEVRKAIPRFIDRPTPWTLNSLFHFSAEKKDLRAAVAFKNRKGRISRSMMGKINADESIAMQVFGGKRRLKASEKTLLRNGITSKSRPYLVPGPGARIDRYGNVPGSFVNKVLYQTVKRGSASQGYSRPLNNRSRSAAKAGQYFIKRGRFGRDATGIFQKKGKGRIVPVFFFVGQPKYNARFPFHNLVEKAAERSFNKRMLESVDVVLKKYR